MLLEFRDVWKGFGSGYVLREVNLSLRGGEVAAVVGPNGSGKTTLLRLAAGLITPSRGRVLVSGVDARRPEAKATVGLLPHTPPLYGDLTVRENLAYYAGLHGLPGISHVRGIIEELGLSDLMDAAVSKLSYGWRKRVDIVRTLIHSPRLVLMDEPTAGLDEPGRRWIRTLLRRISSSGGAVLLTSPTDPSLIVDRVFKIGGDGRVEAEPG